MSEAHRITKFAIHMATRFPQNDKAFERNLDLFAQNLSQYGISIDKYDDRHNVLAAFRCGWVYHYNHSQPSLILTIVRDCCVLIGGFTISRALTGVVLSWFQ